MIEFGHQHPQPADGRRGSAEQLRRSDEGCRRDALDRGAGIRVVFEPLEHPDALERPRRQQPPAVSERCRHLDGDQGANVAPTITATHLGSGGDQHGPELTGRLEHVSHERPVPILEHVQRQLRPGEQDR